MARRPICKQWETDRQHTHINNCLIGPAGGAGMPTDSREGRKTRDGGGGGAMMEGGALFSASLDKQVREEGKADRDAETDL